MLAIRLPARLEKRLEVLAKKTGRTKTFYARKAISDQMDDLEDLYLVRSRLDDVDRGRVELVTLDEALRQRGLV